MRRAAVIIASLLCILPLTMVILMSTPSPGVAAHQDDMNFTLEGKITEKTGNKLTVSGGDNVIFHVVYTDKTQIKKKDGTPGTPQDLHAGVTISVAGDLAESGEITAKTISIEGDASGK